MVGYISLTDLVYFANGPSFCQSGHLLGMSQLTATENLNAIDLREIHDAEFNHRGYCETCADCTRNELGEFNAYVTGLSDWYDEVGQFLDATLGSVGVTR